MTGRYCSHAHDVQCYENHVTAAKNEIIVVILYENLIVFIQFRPIACPFLQYSSTVHPLRMYVFSFWILVVF